MQDRYIFCTCPGGEGEREETGWEDREGGRREENSGKGGGQGQTRVAENGEKEGE
jgi:hypothetical protein